MARATEEIVRLSGTSGGNMWPERDARQRVISYDDARSSYSSSSARLQPPTSARLQPPPPLGGREDYGNSSRIIGDEVSYERKPVGALAGHGFARNFLFVGIVVFAPPCWALLRVATDEPAAFWLGSTNLVYAALTVPFLLVLSFVAQTARGRPIQLVVFLVLLGSCGLLLLASNLVLQNAYSYGNILTTSDCDTWVEKRHLEVEWQAAHSFYATCMSTTANETGFPLAKIASTFLIEDCGLYAEELKKHPDWAYLGALEGELYCAGWCQRGQALWTRQRPPAKDACAISVATALTSSVRPLMTQVAIYSLVVLGISTLGLAWYESLLAALGRSAVGRAA